MLYFHTFVTSLVNCPSIENNALGSGIHRIKPLVFYQCSTCSQLLLTLFKNPVGSQLLVNETRKVSIDNGWCLWHWLDIFFWKLQDLLGWVIQIIHSVSQAYSSPLIAPGIMAIILTIETRKEWGKEKYIFMWTTTHTWCLARLLRCSTSYCRRNCNDYQPLNFCSKINFPCSVSWRSWWCSPSLGKLGWLPVSRALWDMGGCPGRRTVRGHSKETWGATPNADRDPAYWCGKMVTEKSRLQIRFVIFVFHFIERYVEESPRNMPKLLQ